MSDLDQFVTNLVVAGPVAHDITCPTCAGKTWFYSHETRTLAWCQDCTNGVMTVRVGVLARMGEQ